MFDHVKVPNTTISAAFITLLGVAIISVDFQELVVGLGDILTFIGAVFWAVHIYFLGHQIKKHDLFALLSYQLLMFSVLITSIMIFTDGLPTITRGFDDQFNLWTIGIALGFTASFLAFVMQAFGQKYTNAAEAAILISTESVFGPIFAIWIYGEPFSWKLLIGMILVFSGIVLSEMGGNLFKKRTRKLES
jgi:drug/metabolite transporter (DMT)-like permease